MNRSEDWWDRFETRANAFDDALVALLREYDFWDNSDFVVSLLIARLVALAIDRRDDNIIGKILLVLRINFSHELGLDEFQKDNAMH